MGLGAFALNEAKHTPLWTFDNNVVHSNERVRTCCLLSVSFCLSISMTVYVNMDI